MSPARDCAVLMLELIPGMDTLTAQAIITARDSDPPIRNLPQLLAAAGLNQTPGTPGAPGGAQISNFGQQGNTYQVVATATIGEVSHQYTAVVFRTGPNVQVVSFYRTK